MTNEETKTGDDVSSVKQEKTGYRKFIDEQWKFLSAGAIILIAAAAAFFVLITNHNYRSCGHGHHHYQGHGRVHVLPPGPTSQPPGQSQYHHGQDFGLPRPSHFHHPKC